MRYPANYRNALTIVGLVIGMVSSCRTSVVAQSAAKKSVAKKQRDCQFNYGATLKELPADAKVRVWVPIPANGVHQSVELTQFDGDGKLGQQDDPKYGNSIGYFEPTVGKSGETTFQLTYQVSRKEAGADGTVELTGQQRANFLAANRLVPVNGRPTELFSDEFPADTAATIAAAKLYNVVEQHMKYDKSKPGYGNGDSVWACDSKTGNCTDFHSLFISLARSKELPARFEIGFPLPTDKREGVIKGYHCWAWYFAQGKGWTPVDISEADKHPELKDYYFGKLTPDRISFSTGRDIVLVPESAAEPLNYFVYPHVEVDGKHWPKEKIELAFSFKDAETPDDAETPPTDSKD